MFLEITKQPKILLAVLTIFILLVILYSLNKHYKHYKHYKHDSSIELFKDTSANSSSVNLFNDPRYEKDRTRLYGSLFLNNLGEQIKNMTDPRIQYDNKRIDIIKYSDILL